MAINPTIESALFAALLALVLALPFFSRRALLFTIGFLLPLMTPRLAIGIGLDWHKILGPLALAIAFAARSRGPAGPTGHVVWLGLYAIGVTSVWMGLEYAVLQRYRLAAWMGLGEAQSIYKMPVQLGTFLCMLAAAPIVPLLARTRTEVESSVRGATAGAVSSVALGLILLATTGRGMLADRVAFFGLAGSRVPRIGGLSGEPKGLGAIVAVVALYLLAEYLFDSTHSKNKHGSTSRHRLALLAFLVAGLFMTYSTSAWAGFVAGVGTLFALAAVRARRTRMARVFSIAGAAAVLLASSTFALEAAESRFINRLFGPSSEVERQKDAFMLDAFATEPWNAIWGYGLGGADLEVVPLLPWEELQYRRTPTAGTTGMKILGDLGFAGVMACFAVFVGWSRRLRLCGDFGGSAFALAGGVAVMFCSHIAFPFFLFLTGARLSAMRWHEETARLARTPPRDSRRPAPTGVAARTTTD